jgi:hypothetical protein
LFRIQLTLTSAWQNSPSSYSQCSRLSRSTPRRCHTILPSTSHPNPSLSTHKSQSVVAPEPTNLHLRSRPQRVRRIQLPIIICRTSRKTKNAAAGHWNGYATAPSPSGASQFAQIPVRSHRSSAVSSRPGFALRSASSSTTNPDTVEAPLDTTDGTVMSSTSQAIPVALSYLSQISTNAQASAETIVVPSAFRSCLPPPKIRFPLEYASSHIQRQQATVASDSIELPRIPAPRASCPISTNLRTSGHSRDLPGRYPLGFVRTISRYAVCGN